MWFNILVVVALLVLSGTFAGLTLALFSLNLTSLQRKVKMGNTDAERVYTVRKKGNLLLCSLLLGNVASYSIMAIFLGSITSGVIASFIATTLAFVFGEILPQAVFPRYALRIGARLHLLIWAVIILFYPIAAPVSWLLDRWLGKEPPVLWSKKELGEIIEYHEEHGDGVIDEDEKRIILGALTFSEIQTKQVMIPRNEVFLLDSNTKLTPENLALIKEKGHSRVPLYDKQQEKITGILYIKNLIGSSAINEPVMALSDTGNIITVKESMTLDTLLNILVKREMHMALVENEAGNFIGIATLEDIIEEILKTELFDQKH